MTMNESERTAILETTRAKYGDNHWWDSEDPRVLAYYQLNEPIFCITREDGFSLFHTALEKLLGRPVWTHELGVNYEGLKREAEAAWNGTPYSEEGKQSAIQEGIQKLIEKKGAENVLIVDMDKEARA